MPMHPDDCKLSTGDHSEIYQLIVSEFLTGDTLSGCPQAIFLGGQPGAGKTKMRELAVDQFSSVVINADDLREYHPLYNTLKLSEPERASFLVNSDVSLWTQRLIHQAADERRNVIIDGTFGSSDQKMLADTLQSFRDKGYVNQLWIIAVPEEFSKLGIYFRNEMQIQHTGSGRLVSMKVHDLNYKNIPENIKMAMTLVDRVCIFSRSVKREKDQFINNKVDIMYSLERSNPDFEQSAELFLKIRNEPLSPLLKQYYTVRLHEVVAMIDGRLESAVKDNNMEKSRAILRYKENFLSELGIKGKNQEMTL